MKVGDLVWFEPKSRVFDNTGVIINMPEDGTDAVVVLWDDGEICSHDAEEFEVIDERRCEI